MISLSNQLIVCHDAGAANLIMTAEALAGFPSALYHLNGPAKTKWAASVPLSQRCENLLDGVQRVEIVKSGTGWSSDIEHQARKLAKEHKRYSIALIDHWVNYKKRFIRNNEFILPDEIEVSDHYALDIASKTFPKLKITQVRNHYLECAVKRIKAFHSDECVDILYVLEPVPENWQGPAGVSEEYQALDYFKAFIREHFNEKYRQIRFRLHPSEHAVKYAQWIAQNHDLSIVFDHYDDIEESIAAANWVFGCESYGLILALQANKSVFSTIPHWAPPARLPHLSLKHLRDYMS